MNEGNPIIEIDRVDQVFVATVLYNKIVDNAEIKKMEETLFPMIQEEPHANLLLDFTHVRFISSSALGLILRLQKKLTMNGRRLAICCVQTNIPTASNDTYVYEILKIVKLDRIFEIYEDASQALKKLSALE